MGIFSCETTNGLCRRSASVPGVALRGTSDSDSASSASLHKPKPFVTAVRSQPAPEKAADWRRKDSYGQGPNNLIERQIQMAAELAEEQVGVLRCRPICVLIARYCSQCSGDQQQNSCYSHRYAAQRIYARHTYYKNTTCSCTFWNV